MTQRTRIVTAPRNRGTYHYKGDLIGLDMRYESMKGTCQDEVGLDGDCHDFLVDRRVYTGGILNTHNPTSFVQFANYAASGLSNNQIVPWTNFPGELTNSAYALQAAARTNPSRPYVDVVTNVLQLGELTHLIRDVGNNIIKRAGNWNLAYQFGIKPLVGDLVKLTQFHGQVARRVKEIERLYSKRGLRRTVFLTNLSASNNVMVQVNGAGQSFSENVQRRGRRIIKAHCRWLPTESVLIGGDEEAVRLAKKAVLGLTFDASTAWELIPWSWLIDWGYDIGSWFKAHRNIVNARLDKIAIIKQTSTDADFKVFSNANHNMTRGNTTIITKSRALATANPVAHLPFLSANQMGILASLAVTRM